MKSLARVEPAGPDRADGAGAELMNVHRMTHSDGGNLNHAQSYDGNDVTLCGLALEGEQGEWSEATDVPGKITCPACAKVIRYCKSIPASAIRL